MFYSLSFLLFGCCSENQRVSSFPYPARHVRLLFALGVFTDLVGAISYDAVQDYAAVITAVCFTFIRQDRQFAG